MAPKRKAARRDEVALIVVEEVEDAKLKLTEGGGRKGVRRADHRDQGCARHHG